MKALLKTVVVGCVVVLVSGCSHLGTIAGAGIGSAIDDEHPVRGAVIGGVVGAMADDQYNPYNRGGRAGHGQGRVVRGGGYRGDPCQPYNADSLMSWATELDESHQERRADVSNSNGRINCRSSEQAGSRSQNRQNGYRSGNYQQQPQQQVIHQRTRYQAEPQINGWGR